MDWYTIQYLYPESFNKFIKTMFPNVGILSISTLSFFDIKKLYHFFDKEGIFLTLEMYKPNFWIHLIALDNGFCFGHSNESKQTREEIEIDGFYECFKILDKKIRDKI